MIRVSFQEVLPLAQKLLAPYQLESLRGDRDWYRVGSAFLCVSFKDTGTAWVHWVISERPGWWPEMFRELKRMGADTVEFVTEEGSLVDRAIDYYGADRFVTDQRYDSGQKIVLRTVDLTENKRLRPPRVKPPRIKREADDAETDSPS